MGIGVVWEDLYTRHNMGPAHPESPDRLFAIREVIDDVKIATYTTHIHPRPATKEEIAKVHDPLYIDSIEKTAGRFVMLDGDTSTSAESWDAACLAAGGAIACVDHVVDHGKKAFAFVRPPGHHAEHDHAMGFCIFNNIAIAAEYAIRKHKLKKIAILDFDIHHGNGTQKQFYRRSDVFFASTHQSPFYPGTGSSDEVGEGPGKGFNLNIPLAGGSGDKEFRMAWGEGILPRIEAYQPELILVSAGFDAHENDPIGEMRVTTGCFRWLAAELVALSKKVCHGRLIYILEGGYSLTALKSCVRATLEEMF